MKQLKTLHLKNARTLTNQEMKQVLGGSGDVSCTVTIQCANHTRSCSSSIGDCDTISETIEGHTIVVGIRCENFSYYCLLQQYS